MEPIEARVRAVLADFEHELIPCDPDLADTAAFCAHYGYPPEQSANTILVVEAKTAVPWTKPDDIPMSDSKSVMSIVTQPFGVTANVAMMDGSVRALPTSLSSDLLNAWLTRDGQERIVQNKGSYQVTRPKR